MRFALTVARLAVAAALVMGCGLFQGITNPTPETQANIDTLKADAGTLRDDLSKGSAVIPEVATLIEQLGNKDIPGASFSIVTIATQAVTLGGPVLADVKKLVKDFEAVYASATAGAGTKDATVSINLAKARAILDAAGR